MGGRQFQVIALQRVGDAASGEENAPQERGPAALLLQHGEVDMQHQVLPWVVAQQIRDVIQLLPLRDLEHHLARLVRLRLAVEPQAKGAVEQLGQPCGKVGIL